MSSSHRYNVLYKKILKNRVYLEANKTSNQQQNYETTNQQSSKQVVCSDTNCGFQRTQNIKKNYIDQNCFFFDDMIF